MARHHVRRAGHFVRRHHGKITGGAKGTGIAAAIGVGAYFLLQKATESSTWLQGHWYGPPAALVVGGHFLKRKYPVVGSSLIAVGGYVGGLNYSINKASGGAHGYDGGMAGALTAPADVGMLDAGGLTSPSDVGAYDVSEAGMLEG